MSPSALEPTIKDRLVRLWKLVSVRLNPSKYETTIRATAVMSLDHQNQPSLVRYLNDS